MQRIKNVYYRTNDMKEAIDFYQEVMGLKLQFNDRDQWAQFKVGDVTFALGGTEEVPEKLEAGGVVTFEVENIAAMKKRVEQDGIQVSDVREMGSHGYTCYFHDPSNNMVQLYEKQPIDKS
ncbi:VOC family protein [Virgibacillus sediminis]|uniref:VOC family protein n=1 Tax=Virgibacillus sediminis TaxID=202260 RepID=A0ABV7A4Q1_9BACI